MALPSRSRPCSPEHVRPQAVAEKLGLDRVTAEANPELWPADMELIDPIEGVDDRVFSRRTLLESRTKAEGEFELEYDADAWHLRQLLKSTSLEERELIPLYDSADDDFSHEAFHACVDGFGPGILLARTEEGSVFGGAAAPRARPHPPASTRRRPAR